MEKYDSAVDTNHHRYRVSAILCKMSKLLLDKANAHDLSKLEEPEKSIFDKFTPKLKDSTYGSKEYTEFLKEMEPALNHHYRNNQHHPEHYGNGIDGMTILDLLEMFCDWKAASERHADGSIEKSIEINTPRFKISDQLKSIFKNSVYLMEDKT